MAASSKLMISEAERRFPVRIKVALPAGGFGTRLNQMHTWLDENCGADGWAMTPAGLRGVINDSTAIYFADATSAAAVCRSMVRGPESRGARWFVPTPRG